MIQRSQPQQTFEEITAAIRGADREKALTLATSAFLDGDEQPLVLMLEAERLEQAGELAKALTLLKAALGQEQDEPELWRRYGDLLAKEGRIGESLDAFDSALELDPANIFVLLSAGDASYGAGVLRRALDYYRRAHVLTGDRPDVVARIAASYAGLQDSAKAREFACRALANSPRNITAIVAAARADLLDGKPEAALERVQPLLDCEPGARLLLQDVAAEALDALGRTAEAFDCYSERNRTLERLNSAAILQLPFRRADQAKRTAAWIRDRGSAPWRALPDPQQAPTAGHAFILGFPRSGTTLLEKTLACHPGVMTLPEVDLLSDHTAALLQSEAGLDAIFTTTAEFPAALQQRYWSAAAQLLGKELSRRLLVDKLPLHTLALPLIARAFPDARIIFALRDPRDVVLSCFRRRFQLNSATYEFLSLERTAEFYAATMDLYDAAKAALPLQLLEVRQESTVAEFELSIGKILKFLGLSWDPGVSQFSARAKENPRTPSDLQLARGLNSEGVGQWRRYEEQLQSVLPILDPWIHRLGYSE